MRAPASDCHDDASVARDMLLARSLRVAAAPSELWAVPGRALWWPAQRALVVADLHWGRDSYLRRHGIPVPELLGSELQRLRRLATRLQVQTVYVLGDCLHAPEALPDSLVEQVGSALHELGARFVLVIGNHDLDHRSATQPYRLAPLYAQLGIASCDELELEGCRLLHDGDAARGRPDQGGPFVLSGHLHPCVELGGRRLACFVEHAGGLVLPAFTELSAGSRKHGPRVQSLLVELDPRAAARGREAGDDDADLLSAHLERLPIELVRGARRRCSKQLFAGSQNTDRRPSLPSSSSRSP